MKRRLVFFDIDGTLWDSHERIPQSTAEAIAGLLSHGHLPIICSGRSKGHIVNPALLKLGFRGIVAACGGHVEYEGKMIYEQLLSKQLTKQVIDASERCRVPIVLEGTAKQWISTDGFLHDDFVERMYQNLGERAVPLSGYTEDMQVNKFAGDVIAASDYDGFRKELSEAFRFIEHVYFPKDGEPKPEDPYRLLGVFEAVPPHISKAYGIQKLCEYLGEDPQDALALGDSPNDLEMLHYVGTGIAMGNGSETVKNSADYVTGRVEEGGVYQAMKHFGLLE